MINFHSFFIVLSVFVSSSVIAQNPQLVKIWETDSTLKVPESVLYDSTHKVLYVSNIDGKPNEKDLNGSIGKVSLDGKILTPTWAINLSAPKGMGIYDNKLYVADLTEVVVIDLKTAAIENRLPVAGSIFLNDLTITKTGIIYVSDSRTGIVHKIEENVVSTYLKNKMGVNGLLAVDNMLYLAVKDTLFKSDNKKVMTPITTGLDASSDGIVKTGDDFIVSCWNGIIYYVSKDGIKSVLLDTRKEKINTADIGFDPINKIIYVPTFFKNSVVAYRLEWSNK